MLNTQQTGQTRHLVPEAIPSASKFRVAYIPDSEISTLESLNRPSRSYMCSLILSLILYVSIFVLAQYFMLHIEVFFPDFHSEHQDFFTNFEKYYQWIYLVIYMPAVNSIVLVVLGRYALCAALYPY